MTLANTLAGGISYGGTSALATYIYNFLIYQAQHVLVQVVSPAGVPATLTYSTDGVTGDYTVAGVGNGTGGTVTLLNNGQSWLTGGFLTTGWTIYLFQNAPNSQMANLRGQGGYNPGTNETAFDLLMMAIQQVQRQLNQAYQVPITDPVPPAFPTRTLRANGIFSFDANGDPAITGNPGSVNAISLVTTIDSISALKALAAPAAAVTYYLRGYYAAGDGGGGHFRWNSADNTADNGGTIIQLGAGGTGRWNRVYQGAIWADWFGAKGDGSTDDTAAINAAFSFAVGTSGCIVAFNPQKTYSITATSLQGNNPVTVWGYGSTIKLNSTSSPGITVSGQFHKILGLIFTQANSSAHCLAISFIATATYTTTVQDQVRDCYFNGVYQGVSVFMTAATGVVYRIKVINCVFLSITGTPAGGYAVSFSGDTNGNAGGNDSEMDSCLIQNYDVGVYVVNSGQTWLRRVSWDSCTVGVNYNAGSDLTIDLPRAEVGTTFIAISNAPFDLTVNGGTIAAYTNWTTGSLHSGGGSALFNSLVDSQPVAPLNYGNIVTSDGSGGNTTLAGANSLNMSITSPESNILQFLSLGSGDKGFSIAALKAAANLFFDLGNSGARLFKVGDYTGGTWAQISRGGVISSLGILPLLGAQTLTVNSATPSVQNGWVFLTANSSPTTITSFSNIVVGQRFTIKTGDANTTIKNNGTIVTKSGGDVSLGNGATMDFMCFAAGVASEV